MYGSRLQRKDELSVYFSLLDVFCRYHWLVPLERKKSSHVKKDLQLVYKVHGIPERVQSDNGGEF